MKLNNIPFAYPLVFAFFGGACVHFGQWVDPSSPGGNLVSSIFFIIIAILIALVQNYKEAKQDE